MTQVHVDKEFLKDLIDSKLHAVKDEIQDMIGKWGYTSDTLFLKHARDGTLKEAEDDAVCLRNLQDERDMLQEKRQELV